MWPIVADCVLILATYGSKTHLVWNRNSSNGLGFRQQPVSELTESTQEEIDKTTKGEARKMKKKSEKNARCCVSKNTASKIYLLRVSFKSFEDVYADIEVSDTTTYEQLHFSIFDAFNRCEEHLYMFTLRDGTEVVSPYMAYDKNEYDAMPADSCTIGKALRVGSRIDYIFDFGDCWEHIIKIKSVKKAEEDVKYPRILGVHGEVPPQYL